MKNIVLRQTETPQEVQIILGISGKMYIPKTLADVEAESFAMCKGLQILSGQTPEFVKQEWENKTQVTILGKDGYEFLLKEIAELVEALRELNAIVRSNFGVKHPKASELLKKYEK